MPDQDGSAGEYAGTHGQVLAIVHLTDGALTGPRSTSTPAAVAAVHELVLICPTRLAGRVLPVLRAALPRRRIIGSVVSGEVVAHERELVTDLLDEGTVPLILTSDDPEVAGPADWAWLGADASYVLPDSAG
jgi:hypothetical protein